MEFVISNIASFEIGIFKMVKCTRYTDKKKGFLYGFI